MGGGFGGGRTTVFYTVFVTYYKIQRYRDHLAFYFMHVAILKVYSLSFVCLFLCFRASIKS